MKNFFYNVLITAIGGLAFALIFGGLALVYLWRIGAL